jgi:hypothetical protein
MFLYNITYNLEQEIENEWKDWIRGIYLPKLMATGYFEDYKIYKLLNVAEDGITYSVQLFSSDLWKIEKYLEKEAPELLADQNQRFRYKHVAYMTVFQEVGL